MGETVLCVRILMEHGHIFQLPMAGDDARALIEQWENAAPDFCLKGHAFNEEGRPWQWSIKACRVLGIQTLYAQAGPVQQQFYPNPQQTRSHHPLLGRS